MNHPDRRWGLIALPFVVLAAVLPGTWFASHPLSGWQFDAAVKGVGEARKSSPFKEESERNTAFAIYSRQPAVFVCQLLLAATAAAACSAITALVYLFVYRVEPPPVILSVKEDTVETTRLTPVMDFLRGQEQSLQNLIRDLKREKSTDQNTKKSLRQILSGIKARHREAENTWADFDVFRREIEASGVSCDDVANTFDLYHNAESELENQIDAKKQDRDLSEVVKYLTLIKTRVTDIRAKLH